MYGYVYITTNLLNNKKYIGQHKSEVFDTKYFGSGKILLRAILKEGIENFKCEILQWCNSKEELDIAEAKYIAEYDATHSDQFYNLVPGGRGKSIVGCIYVTNGSVNKKILPEELDYYLSIGFRRGGPKPSKETIEKRSKANIGKKRSKETRLKMSISSTGKKATAETRAKQSRAKLGTTTERKGKIIVTKDDTHLYIKPEELDYYLSIGYIKQGIKHKNPSISSLNYSKARKGNVGVTNGSNYYMIARDKLEEYLDKGYTLGKPKLI